MATQVAVALGTMASLAPNSLLGGGSASESTRVALEVQGRRAVQHVTTAAARVWKKTQSRRFAIRAEAGGDASTATTTTKASPTVGVITEVGNDTFWPIVKSAEEKVVVLDMYTKWCGPCKLILPKIQALAATMDDVIFTKLDCNQENKALAKELGIRVVPTFKIFKSGELVTSINGAKYDELVRAIESARKGQ